MAGQSITIDGVRDLDLTQTFGCGQCFRWRRLPDGSWTGIALARAVNMRFEPQKAPAGSGGPGRLTITALDGSDVRRDRERWLSYLDLYRDYGAVKGALSGVDPRMAEAVEAGAGIRILRQDIWETILSFMISQNNNIPRIRGCIERLAGLAGCRIPLDQGTEAALRAEGLEPCTLPEPEVLAGMSCADLEPVHLGYRDRYLLAAAREVLERGMPESYDEVLALTGAGPKVAGCIALFGLGETASFPIDVWMRRVMAEVYGFDERDVKGMRDFAAARYGRLGGFAQQYLYYFIREKSQK